MPQVNPLRANPTKMVKHTQTIFVELAVKRLMNEGATEGFLKVFLSSFEPLQGGVKRNLT